MKPKRIQRKRTRGWKMPPNTVYVGRPSKWGNQVRVGVQRESRNSLGHLVGYYTVTPAIAVSEYRDYIIRFGLREKVKEELRGKNLACWCALGEPCHADVLLEIANEDAPNAR